MISTIIPLYREEKSPLSTVETLVDFFKPLGNFEILIVLNPTSGPTDSRLIAIQEVFSTIPQVKVLGLENQAGKGAALKHGFQHARGNTLFTTDADLPFGIEFLEKALAVQKKGVDFVTSNRKHPQSFIQFPVKILPYAFSRLNLGYRFNQIARIFLGVRTRDTQAGSKVFSRRFAEKAFASQTCTGFFHDLEHFMVMRRQKFTHFEIPVTYRMSNSISTIRYLPEFFKAVFWIFRIRWNGFQGYYDV